MRTFAIYSLVVLWGALLVLWPRESNRPQASIDRRQAKTGEDLYKSALTQANFGLLGVSFYESENGKKRWNIRSKFAELHRKENYSFLQTVDADFFAQKTGNLVITKSDYGRSYLDKSVTELRGDVSIRSRRGYLFEMDKLNYDGKNHQFSTDDPVRMKGPSIKQPSMFLRGVGLLGSIDEEHFFLRHNVSAQKLLKSSEWMRINSRTGEFFTDDQRAIFIGKVRSVLPKTLLESDRLELLMDGENQSLHATGNVVMRNKTRQGWAESAFIELGSDKIILEGKARINSKDNQIQGKRIVLFSDEDRVEVEQAEGKVLH